MANSNVRFYKLATLPSFVLEKHNGIFVHVTETMHSITWKPTVGNEVNPKTLWMTPEKSGESVERINLVKWLSTRHITEIASGLWFGGENGWELLSNDTTSGAIDAAIDAKIATLQNNGYAQAEITTTTNSSTLTIKGIKEDNGIIGIPDSENLNFKIAIDGVYTESNKIATQSTVTTAITTAINNLDANTVQAVTFNTPVNGGNTTLTFNGIKEADGIISQGDGATTFIVGDAKLKIQIGSNEASAFDVFSANAQSDGAIKLNEYVFEKDENNVISVITPTAVSERNRLVTEQDIANLSGAMHYKGSIASDTQWPANENVKAGDVYIVTTSFTHSGESNPFEVGDMIVFNGPNNYNVIQSNITLGTGIGQVAANSAALAKDKIVVASENGIETIDFDGTNLTSTENGNNTRNLTIANGNINDNGFHHAVTITDTFKVIGKDFSKSIDIKSNNRSIDIAQNGNNGVMVDLVWNTTIE